MRPAFVRRLLALTALATAPLLAIAQAPPATAERGVDNKENAFLKPPQAREEIVANQPYDIEWTPSANPGTVSIFLYKGSEPNLQQVATVVPAIANSGKFTWTPPLSLQGLQTMPADQVYQFKIVNDITGNFGFSNVFKLNSADSTFVASSAAASAPSSSAAPSSSDAAGENAATTSTSASSTGAPSSSSIASSTSASQATSSASSSSTATITSSSVSTSTSQTSTRTTLSTVTTAPSSSKSSTTSTGTAASAAAETASTSSSSATATAAPVAAAGKMSTGAIAGITAGTIGAIILAVVVVFLVRRSKQVSRQRLVGSTPAAPSKYDRDFQMMERRARHRPTSSFGFNTTRSDTSGGGVGAVGDRHDPYVPLNDRDSYKRDSGTWMASRF
ncbi:hypothetical protein Dda_6671 [Drechslerella dactyloides]|uniref:Yeast cell wall synthesis Kre9/Knh1-like N-terminal domain-containing protein n=1 Tax=Drechslerella dactyloides TaxID=74499 RepID=A0AAD6NHL5_DREDA|nr:hypothetical protein Dda_6671 [Drechslerella dactyloides]